MSWISASDPLALLALSTGQISTPTTGGKAKASDPMDGDQQAAAIGDVVPIVFGVRTSDGTGGVMLSPLATECCFKNDSTNAVTAYYLLVLGQGQMGGIQVRDVFQSNCRVGTFTQAFNARAGLWDPGNYITDQSLPVRRFFSTDHPTLNTAADVDQQRLIDNGKLQNPIGSQLTSYPYSLYSWHEATLTNPAKPDDYASWAYTINGTPASVVSIAKTAEAVAYTLPVASTECGTVGFYPGITTLSFQYTVPNGLDFWKKKVNIFIRGGMWVQRLSDGATGPSDSFPDLVRWLMQQTARVPDALIDATALAAADTFTRANGLTCNGVISASSNLSDFITQWARYFLLSESSANGKRGLRPLLPVNSNGSINTSAVAPVYFFDEALIVPDSLEISYVQLGDRLPFVCQVIWRQQQENDFGIVRTVEVAYDGTTSPKETHDLSQFCTSELHAVRVAAYILARRTYVTHTAKWTAQPDSHNALLKPGDIVRLKVTRTATQSTPTVHDYYYQLERITKSAQGSVVYEATHFPTDPSGRSLVALDVANVAPTGITLPSNQSGVACDLNSSSNTSVPTSVSRPGSPTIGRGTVTQPRPTYTGGYSGGYGSGGGNASDGLGDPAGAPVTVVNVNNQPTTPTPEAALVAGSNPCGDGSEPRIVWYVDGQAVPQMKGRVVIGYGFIQVGSGKKMYFKQYCGNAVTAQSSEITIQPKPSARPNPQTVYIRVSLHNSLTGGDTETPSDLAMSYPITQADVETAVFQHGEGSYISVTGWRVTAITYTDGTTYDYSVINSGGGP